MNASQESRGASAKKRGSVQVAEVAGIPVYLHWSLFLLLGWAAFLTSGGLAWMALLLALYVCVALHECGHALMARHFGVKTADITLFPFGGVAMLKGHPEPKSEIWIALAGPAVNLVIAAGLAAVCAIFGQPIGWTNQPDASFLSTLLAGNLSIALFNLIPAFPMDGGRVLRALLAMRTSELKATKLAAALGQAIAVILGVVGLMGNFVLVLIAVFVFIAAGQESMQAVTRSLMAGHLLEEAMLSDFRALPHAARLEEAAELALSGSQKAFPVVSGDSMIGLITADDIADGLADGYGDDYVAGHMRRDFKVAPPEMELQEALELFTREDRTPVFVVQDDELLGMVTEGNLDSFLVMEQARHDARRRSYGYLA